MKICALELRSLGIMRHNGTLLPLHLEHFLDLYRVDLPCNGFNMNFLEIILLSACQGEPAAPANVTPLISRCLGAASMRYRVGRFGADDEAALGGPGVFTIIDKRGFIRQFFSEVSETEFQAKAEEYREGIRTLVKLNRRYRQVAAAVHLAEAWKQYTSIFVVCHSAAVISREPDNSEHDLRDFMSSLLMPVLLILRERGPALSMQILESVASTLFILVRELCSLPKRGASGAPLSLSAHAVLSEEDADALLSGIVTVILTSVTGFMQPQGESVKLRGFLYASLSAVLTGVCGYPSSLNGKLEVATGNRYKVELSGSGERDTVVHATVARVLEMHATELTDALGRDMCAAPLLWQLNACAALSNITNVFGQSGIRTALQVLLQRGYLLQMLSVVDTLREDAAGGLGLHGGAGIFQAVRDEAQDQRAHREYFVSVISLCTHIASIPDGTTALLQTGDILKRLNASPIFKRAPPSLDGLGGVEAEDIVRTWVSQLLPVLRLLRVLAVTCPSRQVLQGIAEFIHNNRESVVYILRLRLKTLTGLVLAECATSLLAVIASAPSAPLRRDTTSLAVGSPARDAAGTSDGSGASLYLWDSLFQSFGNTLLADLCDILRTVGGDPFPKELARKYGVSCNGAFWAHFVAAPGPTGWVESEQDLANICIYNDEEFKDFPRSWSAFDHMKLDLSLQVAIHISTLLRLRTHDVIEQGFSGNRAAGVGSSGARGAVSSLSAVLAIDLESVVLAFCKCSALSRACAGPGTDAEHSFYTDQHARPEEKHASSVPGTVMSGFQAALTSVAENLVTALHDMTMTGCDWKPGLLEAVLNEAQIPGGNHRQGRQFINELGRVMRYKNQVTG